MFGLIGTSESTASVTELVVRDYLSVARLFHIARAVDWEQATADGAYRVSTLGRRLEEVGYIHLSFAHQFEPVADAVYRRRDDLLLLEIDPARLRCPVVVEDVDGSGDRFPARLRRAES